MIYWIKTQNWQRGGALATLVTLGACAFQLATPYDSSIDANAQNLERNFLTFVEERQAEMPGPGNYYSDYVKTYAAFDADLTAIEIRDSQDGRSATCAEMTKLASQLWPQAASRPVTSKDDAGSCVRQQTKNIRDALAQVQKQDAKECSATSEPGKCGTLFPLHDDADLIPGPGNDGQSPFVNGTIVAIDGLVGLEQDVKPKGGQ